MEILLLLLAGSIVILMFSAYRRDGGIAQSLPEISPPQTPSTGGETKMTLAEKLRERFYRDYTPPAFDEITQAIVKWSKEFDLIPEWVASVAIAESSYGYQLTNPYSSAVGVMQITKATLDTINNIIRAKYKKFIDYSYHDHDRILHDHDSNIMHACVYMRYILNLISLKYNRANKFDDYILMQYLYHSGPAYLDRFEDDYETIIRNIKYDLTKTTVTSPYNWSSIAYVRKVYGYYLILQG